MILSGLVAVVEEVDDKERVIAIHGPRRFLGELNLLTGQPSFTTARVPEPGEVLAVPLDELRELVNHDTGARRPADQGLPAAALAADRPRRRAAHHRLALSRRTRDACASSPRATASRTRWIDLEEDAEAETLLRKLGVSPDETPVVIWRGRRCCAIRQQPSSAE